MQQKPSNKLKSEELPAPSFPNFNFEEIAEIIHPLKPSHFEDL